VPVCGFIHIYLAVFFFFYGFEIIVWVREIVNIARGFWFLRVSVAVIQTEIRGSED